MSAAARAARAEVRALASLRESEHVLMRARRRKHATHDSERRVEQCERRLHRAHETREKMASTLRDRAERCWRQNRRLPRAGDCVDTVGVVTAFGVAVPAKCILTASDVALALARARVDARAHDAALTRRRGTELTARCVLPPFIAGPLATCQNISVREHAALSLLARWLINARPPPPLAELRRTAARVGVSHYLPMLEEFRRTTRASKRV